MIKETRPIRSGPIFFLFLYSNGVNTEDIPNLPLYFFFFKKINRIYDTTQMVFEILKVEKSNPINQKINLIRKHLVVSMFKEIIAPESSVQPFQIEQSISHNQTSTENHRYNQPPQSQIYGGITSIEPRVNPSIHGLIGSQPYGLSSGNHQNTQRLPSSGLSQSYQISQERLNSFNPQSESLINRPSVEISLKNGFGLNQVNQSGGHYFVQEIDVTLSSLFYIILVGN